MNLCNLIQLYMYSFDGIDVYNYRNCEYMYTAKKPQDIGGDWFKVFVKQFAVYETDDKSILEIYV